MTSLFTDLGRTVLDRWKETDFSLPAFPKIACEAIEEFDPSGNVDLSEVIRDFLLNEEQPSQGMSGFGQPEIIVYEHPRLYIQLLFWLDGTTDIHQHEFSGAFHVLAGSSIHSEFVFENVKPVTAHFRLGDLKLKETQLLETGSTVPITSGTSCIHSLFHLETPSVTLVVRTQTDPGTGPQFTYLPPHVALDPVQEDALTARRKQLLDVLARVGVPEYVELVSDMVEDLDFERGFFILQNCMEHLRVLGGWELCWDLFEKKHGAIARKLLPTLDEVVRRDRISGMRATVEDVEHRFFLALLLNVPSRERILEMIAERNEGDPIETAMRWAEELLSAVDGTTLILDASFPEELEIPEEEQPEPFLAALGYFLRGGKRPSGLSKEALEAMRTSFVDSSWKVLIPSARKK